MVSFNYASAMFRRIIRVGTVLLIIGTLAFIAGWLWGPAASTAAVVIAFAVLGMFYVPSWGTGQATEQDRIRERLVQNATTSNPRHNHDSEQQDPSN